MGGPHKGLEERLLVLPWARAARSWLRRRRVRVRSPHHNLFHCCTHRTASRWLRAVLDDPAVHRYCGLDVVGYEELGLRKARIGRPFPARTIVAHLHVSYTAFCAIPKPASWRAFFVLRDPRDVLVCWYRAARAAPGAHEPVTRWHQALAERDTADGLLYLVGELERVGTFSAQRSWVELPQGDAHVRLFRFEALDRDPPAFLRELLGWLEIPLPRERLVRLARRYSYARFAGGRRPDRADWRRHFDQTLERRFRAVTGDLVEALGYRW
jgi:hypothetical protein